MHIKELFQGKLGHFFLANAFACVGMNIGVVGVAWFIIHSTGKNGILGLYGAVSLISSFFALTWCAGLIDHYGKTTIMKYCCLGQGILFALTAGLFILHLPALWIIALLAILNMPCMVIFTTASRGAVPAVISADRLAQGNAVIEITLQLGAMAAALLTAVSYQKGGFHVLMLLGAGFTWAGAWLFARARADFDCPSAPSQGLWTNICQGWGYLCQNKILFAYGLIVFLPTVIIAVSNVMIPGYVKLTLQKGAHIYGIADLFFAVGALLAGLYTVKLIPPKYMLSAQVILFLATAFGLGAFLFNQTIGGFFACVLFTGLTMASLRVLLNTSFMQWVPPSYLGRSLAFLTALSVLMQAILSYLIGRLMDTYGTQSGFLFSAGVLWITAFVLASLTKHLPSSR